MSPNQDPGTLLQRVRSAHLVRVLVVYAAASWVVIQALDILSQHFTLPKWFFPAGLALLAIGLPILVATALSSYRAPGAFATHTATSWRS